MPAMLTITPIKAALVFYYFMHLKYERPMLQDVIVVALDRAADLHRAALRRRRLQV